jgi:hypothetical protein
MTGRQALERAVYEADAEALGDFIVSAAGKVVNWVSRLNDSFMPAGTLYPIFVRKAKSRTKFSVGYINDIGHITIDPTK